MITRLAAILLCLLLPVQVLAVTKLTLKEAVENGLRTNKDLLSTRTRILMAEALNKQARFAGLPGFSLSATLAPTYSSRGDASFSVPDYKTWGPWVQGQMTILQPVYTFGRLTAYRSAARYNIEAVNSEIEQKTHEVAYEIKKYYYTFLYARDSRIFVEGVLVDLEEAVKEASGSGKKAMKKRDRLRLDVFREQARILLEEAGRGERLAKMAFAFMSGHEPTADVEPAEENLEKSAKALRDLPSYLDGIKMRPEIQRLTKGILAKENLAKAEGAAAWPQIFAGVMLNAGWTNVKEKQISDYAYDPYNNFTIGVGVGFKWDFDLGTARAKSDSMTGEKIELETKMDFALSGLEAEVRKGFEEVSSGSRKLEAAKAGLKAGEKWLASETMGFSMGLVEAKDYVEAYLARAKSVADYMSALLSYNMAWAELERACSQSLEF